MKSELRDEGRATTEPADDGAPAHQDASLIAGETDVPVGAVTGEFPAEQVQAAREREAATGKHAFLVMAGIFLSRVVGLVRQRVMAHYFGTTDVGDAFNVALRIPNFLQNVFGEGALSASFIPVYAGLLAHDQEEEADHVASAVFSLLALTTSVLVVLGVLLTPYLISVIALGYTGAKRDLTITLVRIFFPSTGLLVLSAWCLGVLNSHRRFFLSYTAPVLWNLAIISTLIFFGARAADDSALGRLAQLTAWGSVVGSALQFGVQLPTVLRLIRRLRPVFDTVSAHVREVIRNFFPVFMSRGVVQISAFVDAMLASLLGQGAVAALAYTQSLYTLPVSLFGMSVSAAELPAMAAAKGSDDERAAQLRRRLDSGLRQIAFFIVPSAMAFLALGDVIVDVLYRTGRFTAQDTLYVWAILAGSTVGLLASTLGRLYSSTYYALRDTRTPLVFATVRVVLTTVLGYLCALPLMRLLGVELKWGAVGLTASAGLSGWVEFYLLRRKLNGRIGRTGLPAGFVAKLWAAAAAGAGAGWGIRLVLPLRNPFLVAALVLIPYGLTYFAVTYLFGLPELRALLSRFARFLRR
ncbi:MAG TPA: murein biosynthesis integral membrane protein MurJ [Pyrinomonadaceae bacterium]|jgi:putative peptidoglycan lipid II flippase